MNTQEDTAKQTTTTELPDNSVVFALTPKEELAVIVERLKQHVELAKDARCKERLEIGMHCIRAAIYLR